MPINNTPLEDAAKDGNLPEVRRLLEQGADPFKQDEILGWRPLDMAIMAGHLEVVQELVRRHPDLVHTRDKRNATPLHAASCGHTEMHAEMAKELLQHGADVTAVNEDNQTPLDLARMRNAGTGLAQILEEAERNANK